MYNYQNVICIEVLEHEVKENSENRKFVENMREKNDTKDLWEGSHWLRGV